MFSAQLDPLYYGLKRGGKVSVEVGLGFLFRGSGLGASRKGLPFGRRPGKLSVWAPGSVEGDSYGGSGGKGSSNRGSYSGNEKGGIFRSCC